jgi:hypothetical protein
MAMVHKFLGGKNNYIFPIETQIQNQPTNHWIVWATDKQIQSLCCMEGKAFKKPTKGNPNLFKVVSWADKKKPDLAKA